MSEQTTAGALRYIVMSAHSTQEQKSEAREALKRLETATLYQRGDLVWCRHEAGEWRRGIVTDVFCGPVSRTEVVVVNGIGYYADLDVCPDPLISVEPQSIRA